MKIVAVIARILLGLLFFILGLNGFLNFIPSPPIPGPAGTFIGVLISSHYVLFIAGVQLIAGALLLVDQFVPLALALLAPVLANILVFHVTMQPSGLPMALLTAILWVILVWRFRSSFAPLLVRKATAS